VAPLVAAEGDGQVVPPAALHVAIALGDEAAELAGDPVEVVRGEDGRGAGREAVPPLAAEQAVQRDARGLARDVPERHVDGADAERDQPAVAVPERRVAETAPDARDIAGVRAHDQGRQAPLDDERHREGGFLATRDRLAPADEPVVGLDADQRQGADRAVVVRFWVAHRERLDTAYSHGPSSVSGAAATGRPARQRGRFYRGGAGARAAPS